LGRDLEGPENRLGILRRFFSQKGHQDVHRGDVSEQNRLHFPAILVDFVDEFLIFLLSFIFIIFFFIFLLFFFFSFSSFFFFLLLFSSHYE